MNDNAKISTDVVERWTKSTRMNVEREVTAFERLLPGLLSTHPGWFVAICDGEVVDRDRDEFRLADRVSRRFSDRFVLVQEVTSSECVTH
jgi:hypothetical protein